VTIDDFRILKVVGRGAFGKVMLCEKKSDDTLYNQAGLSNDGKTAKSSKKNGGQRSSLLPPRQYYAMKSLRKTLIIEKGQVEHTQTEKEVLQNVFHHTVHFLDQPPIPRLTLFCLHVTRQALPGYAFLPWR
jgi:serum/glucocorticoid-regulated kinase 2